MGQLKNSHGGNDLFPRWECFVPTAGIFYSHGGNFWGLRFSPEFTGRFDRRGKGAREGRGAVLILISAQNAGFSAISLAI